MTEDSSSAIANLGIRPLRVAVVVALIVVGAIVVNLAVARASFTDGLLVVVALPTAVVATGRLVGLLRGTVAHTTINVRPRANMSYDSGRAFTPSAIIAIDGLLVATVIRLLTGGEGAVARPVMLGAGAVAIVFIVLAFFVAATRRPRFLLPATMRPKDRDDPAVV